MTDFVNVDSQLFFKSTHSNDPRLSSKLIHTPKKGCAAILGYPDDDGIALNGGRIGAAEAPDNIRNFLYRMTEDPNSPCVEVFDAGNLSKNKDLASRHEVASAYVLSLLQKEVTTIGLGGGHDYGYVDGKAFLNYCKLLQPKNKPVIINFDAHLDVRPPINGLNSGTPFFRLYQEEIPFHFFEIGIQPQCNSQEHLNWCLEREATIIAKSFEESGLDFTSRCLKSLESIPKNTPCFVSVDIDYFDSSYAQGCSQSWPTGLDPTSFFKTFQYILSRFQVKNLGIYEVSPRLDKDHQTSKLAALIAYKMLGSL